MYKLTEVLAVTNCGDVTEVPMYFDLFDEMQDYMLSATDNMTPEESELYFYYLRFEEV